MKNSKFLRKLLSAVCCMAMLVTMLPILPAAAADAGVFFEDDFSKHTVGAFDAASHGYKMTKASGTPVVNIAKDGSNQVMTITGARPYIEMGTPEGAFTVQFDFKRNASSSGLFELWMGDLGGGKTIRFRIHDNGAFGFVDTATSKNYLVQNDGGFSSGGYNANRKDSSNALIEANTWYQVSFVADPEANTVKLVARERDNASANVYEAERTMPDFSNYVLRMDGQDMTDSGSKINVSVDNIKVFNGAKEISAPTASTPAAGGTAISSGSMNNFSDAAEITYTKAVDVTAGLGLFAGAEGKFMPKANVTRAQMATIIVKMLYGGDVNADAFKGTGKFTDVATFEGGWAEGYVNWCSTLGIVAGYGDGTFRPGSNVTTAEAATMILNALKVDAGEGAWPHTVMAKAEELDMFDDLSPKPANDKALSREELAVMALVGLEYSPEGKQGYMYDGKFYENYMDAFMVAGGNASQIEIAGGDSLASKVYELKTFEGYIVANQGTDADLDYTVIANREGMEKQVFIQTGLEHLGHWVTAYYAEAYQSEEEPGVAYTLYDETKVYTVADEDIDTAKEYKALFGKNYRLNAGGIAMFDGQYVLADDLADTIPGYVAGSYAPMGTYFVNEGAIVAYREPVTVYAAKVLAVNTYEGNETIELSSKKAPIPNAENDDRIVEYKGIKEDDYVTYTMVGEGANAIYVLTKATAVTGNVTKITTNEDGQRVVTVKSKQYVAFGADNNTTGLNTGDVADFNNNYTFYVTADGKYLGWKTEASTADLSTTVFIMGELTLDKADTYGKITRTVYARGVDLNGKEVMLPVKVIRGEDYNKETKEFGSITETVTDPLCAAVTANTFYKVKDATDKDAKKEGLSILTAYTAEYDEETMPIYYGSYATVNGGTFWDSDMLINGVYSYKKSSTIYITLDGNVAQSEPLTATVKKGSMTAANNNTGMKITRHILLSRSQTGTVELEAVVLVVPDAELFTGGEIVYIAESALENASRGTDGYVYDVYAYSTAATKQITTEKPLDEYDVWAGSSFYNLQPISGTECVEPVSTIAPAKNNSPSDNDTSDGVYYEEFFYDQVLFDMSSDKFNTLPIASFGTQPSATGSYGLRLGKKPAGAVVVDLRSEQDILDAGVGKIDSMERVANLTQRDKDMVILMDMCYSSNKDALLTVFVKDVYYSTKGTGLDLTKDAGTYYLNGYAVASNVEVEGNGVTSIEDIYGLLNPAASAPGYPPAEPANVEVQYVVTGGKITAIEVTKLLQAGVFFTENFETFDIGTVDANVAKAHDYTYTVASGTPSLKVENKNGSKVLTIAAKRPYLYLGAPDSGAYTLSFDVMRPANGNDGGLTELWIATVSGGTIRLRLWDNGSFGIIDSTVSKMNFLMQNNGGFSAGGLNASRDDATNAKMAAGTWYTIETVVDPSTKVVTMTAYERDDASGDSWSASKIMPNTFTNSTIQIDGNTDLDVSLDNFSCTALGDWEYPISVVQPDEGGSVSVSASEASMGTQITVTATPDAGYALNTIMVKHGSGAYEAIDGNTFVVGTDPVTVTAEFDTLYNVSVGTVTGGTATVDKAQALPGETITVTATPDDPTNAAEISVNGNKIDGNTFQMPAEDVTVTVEFIPDPTERLVTLDAGTGGTVVLSGNDNMRAVGEVVYFNIQTEDGYRVKSYTVKTAGGQELTVANHPAGLYKYSFTMPAEEVTVTVEFESLIVMQDDFETGYTVGNFYDGTNKNATAVAKGYGFTKASGSPVMNIVQETGNKVLQVTAARPYVTIGDPNASFTLKFDVRRDADSAGMLDVWVANQAANTSKTYRFRILENGAVSLADSKTSYNYYVQTDGTLRQSGNVWLSDRTNANNKLMAKDVWYTVEIVVTMGSKDIELKVYERDNASNVLCDVTQTMGDTCAHRNVQFDPQTQTSEPTISLDNIDLRKNG